MASIFRTFKQFIKNRFIRSNIPLDGHPHSKTPTPLLELLNDSELKRINEILPWSAFTVDTKGRRFGGVAWKGKRSTPQIIPDPRILLMHKRFDLSNKTVLEIGCFEGIHTAGLAQYSSDVKAIDSRIDNVVKTIVRCAMLGYKPDVFLYDVENTTTSVNLLEADIAHHVGVLYHLKDPVSHILNLGEYVKTGLMLDTHYANKSEAQENYTVNGIEYKYKHYQEHGYSDVFSGMHNHSKWLMLDDIITLLKQSGFTNIEISEKRQERNGARCLIFASR